MDAVGNRRLPSHEFVPSERDGVQEYPYQALDRTKGEIRILVVEPGLPPNHVFGSLHLISLKGQNERKHTTPKYEAISYAYGDPQDRSRIIVDGVWMSVPATAERALQGLRHNHDLERSFWIDAVCINQSNWDERACQVALMGDIYREARRTLVWLGEANETVADAFRIGKEATQALKKEDECDAQLSDSTRKAVPDLIKAHPCLEASRLTALQEIFRRPWFGRLWVLQEAVLARDVICICGPYSMPMLDIARLSLFCQYGARETPNVGVITTRSLYYFLLDGPGRKGRQGYRLYHLLNHAEERHTTVPHDRVYAILGMTRWAASGLELPPSLWPDYSSPAEDVVLAAVEVAEQEEEELSHAGPLYTYARNRATSVGRFGELTGAKLGIWRPESSLWHKRLCEDSAAQGEF